MGEIETIIFRRLEVHHFKSVDERVRLNTIPANNGWDEHETVDSFTATIPSSGQILPACTFEGSRLERNVTGNYLTGLAALDLLPIEIQARDHPTGNCRTGKSQKAHLR
ncbi:hypothetical protein ACLOJK_039570 [Asimina triloba]